MIEGFWIVQFEAIQGNGSGVVVFIKGKVFGGDGETTYTGDYRESEGRISARIFIHNYKPGFINVIGVEGDYWLDIEGTIEGKSIQAQGRAVEHDVVGMAIKLTKVDELPL